MDDAPVNARTYAVADVFYTIQGEGSQAGRPALFVRLAGCNLWTGQASRRNHDGAGASCALWCDTDFRMRERLSAAALAARAYELTQIADAPDAGAPMVVITGGEPMLQLDRALLRALWLAGFREVWVETNGTCPPLYEPSGKPQRTLYDDRGSLHYTLSPKRGPKGAVHRDWFTHVATRALDAELKLVFPGGSALVPGWTAEAAEEVLAALSPRAAFLQPQDPIDAGLVGVTWLSRNASPGVMATTRARPTFSAAVAACIDLAKRNHAWRISVQTHKVLDIA